MDTCTLAFLCAVTNYREYLVKFAKVTVVMVDYPEMKVILIFKIKSQLYWREEVLKRGHDSISMYDTPGGYNPLNWCEWNLFGGVVYERFNRKNTGTLCV
jgi:hypothetical protein